MINCIYTNKLKLKMNKYYNESLVLARLLMSFLFLYAGYGKIIG